MSSITYLHSPTPPIKLEITIPDGPLDLSLRTLEEGVIQKVEDQIPIQQISQELTSSVYKIYSIITKKSLIKIKSSRKYTPSIKYRVQEAYCLGIPLKKIAKIFNLKKSQVIYINCLNRDILIEQLCHSINLIPNRNSPPMTIEKLKTLLRFRRIQQFKEET